MHKVAVKKSNGGAIDDWVIEDSHGGANVWGGVSNTFEAT